MARNEKLGRWLPLVFALCALGTNAAAENDPLPSWNEGAAKTRILTFVKQATDQSSATFVELEDRIAVFDQDGTLWVEQPIYTQAMFAFDQVKRLAPRHPEWTTTEPFKTVLAGDPEALSRLSRRTWSRSWPRRTPACRPTSFASSSGSGSPPPSTRNTGGRTPSSSTSRCSSSCATCSETASAATS
jgi:hypothetical protein